jgi:hypothetical protein
MMAHDENANRVSKNPKKKVIRKSQEIHSANVVLSNRKGFRSFSRLLKKMP